jgi:hypothetical protein
VAADLYHFEEQLDPDSDPHESGKLDPDRIKVKITSCKRLKIEPWTLKIEPWRVKDPRAAPRRFL